MIPKKISWIFICQAGRLEREAAVLAVSLRSYLGAEARLIAASPQPESLVGKLDVRVVQFLESLDVEIRSFTNPLIDKPGQGLRLLMNKAYTLTLDRDSDVNVFLDSDQICHAPIDPRDFVVPFLARSAMYVGTVGMSERWQRAFDLCDAPIPQQQLILFSENDPSAFVVAPPTFNSGFISVHQVWAHQLQLEYVECFHRLRDHNILGAARYFTEQVALGIAVAKIGIPYRIDDYRIDRWFSHYYTKERLAKFPKLVAVVQQLCQDSPQLFELLREAKEWEPVVQGFVTG